MKAVIFFALLGLGLSACQSAPQLQAKAEFAPVAAPPQMRGNTIGISNESGSTQVYGSVAAEMQHHH